MGAALVSPKATVRAAALSSLPEPFCTWSPADALLGLLTLGEAEVSLTLTNEANRIGGAAARIAAGIDFAGDWPNSLSRFAKKSTIKSNSISVRHGLGTLGSLFRQGSTKTPIRDLVRSAISASLAEAAVPAKLYSGGIVDSTCRAGMLCARDAAKQLGISLASLAQLEGRSATFLVRQNVSGGLALYDKASISRLAEDLRNSVKPKLCGRQLGIPPYCIPAFISAQLLEVVTNSDAVIVTGGTLISSESITNLLNRLVERSKKFEGGVTLLEAMRRNGDPQDWVNVFEQMLAGKIRFFILNRECSSLDEAMIVSTPDIMRHISRRCSGPEIDGVDVCCESAAKIIGANADFISNAMKIGLIDGKVEKKKSIIKLESVLKFQNTFILPNEIHDHINLSKQRVGIQLRSAGYMPVAIANHTRIWRRPDIAKYIEEHKDPAAD